MTMLFSSERDEARRICDEDGYRSAPLQYTTSKPTVDGWYWVKALTSGGSLYETIAKVYNKGTTVFYDGENFSIDSERFRMWAGPIPKPF
jgi:hypothetical protein